MKLFKAGSTQTGNAVAFNRAALEDFPDFPAAPEEIAPEEEVVEEKIDIEALRAEVIAEAREEAARLVQQAYQEGLKRGEEAGRTAFEERVATLIPVLEEAARSMQDARDAFLNSLEPQVVELVALAARRTLQREMATDAELLKSTVRRALAKLSDRQRIVVRLNPSDIQAMSEQKLTLIEDFHGVEEFHVAADDNVTPGSCVVDSQTMQADARLESLLEDVLAQLWN